VTAKNCFLVERHRSWTWKETRKKKCRIACRRMASSALPHDYKGDFFEDFKAMIASSLHPRADPKCAVEKGRRSRSTIHTGSSEQNSSILTRNIFAEPPAAARPARRWSVCRLDACQDFSTAPGPLGKIYVFERHE